MAKQDFSIRVLKEIGRLASDGLVVFDVQRNKIVYCNEGVAKILGVEKPTVKKKGSLRKLIVEDDSFINTRLEQLTSEYKINDIELRIVNQSKYISCDAYFLRNKNRIVVFVKDVSNTKQHANYITEFGARKDAILDMVAHNLSGPLNMTNNLLNLVDQLNEAQHYRKVDNHTRIIRENTQHCIEIINSFLEEEHLASERIFVQSTRFDVIDKIRIVIERLKEFNSNKAIIFNADRNELFVTGDDVKFFQIIHNLLSNAIKFTNEVGLISVKVYDEENLFKVTVKDNGIGIPEYLQPHIFRKNSPAARTGLRGEKSIGMGLYIVKKLVKLMNGDICFESEENKGTTFVIQLPKVFD